MGILSMPNSLHMPFYLKTRGVKENPFQCMAVVPSNSMGSRCTSQTSPQAYSVQLWILIPTDWLKHLPKYLSHWLVGPPHHIHSTQDFVEQANKVTLIPEESLISYGVTVLFTSVPVYPALCTIKDLLEKDRTLKEITVLPVKNIIFLMEFCLKTLTFLSRVSTMNR